MNTLSTRFITRTIAALLAAWLGLGFIDLYPWHGLLVIAFVVSLTSMLVSDLLLLLGRGFAYIGHGVVAAFVANIIDSLLPALQTSPLGLGVFAGLIILAEFVLQQISNTPSFSG